MQKCQRLVGAAGILVAATIGSASAQTATSPVSPSQGASQQTTGQQATPQIDKPSAGTRAMAWTRSKLDAAKKRWAQDKKKFADCQKQLAEKQKVERLSLHKQGRFLEQCMSSGS